MGRCYGSLSNDNVCEFVCVSASSTSAVLCLAQIVPLAHVRAMLRSTRTARGVAVIYCRPSFAVVLVCVFFIMS